jgi:hypothetical protein
MILKYVIVSNRKKWNNETVYSGLRFPNNENICEDWESNFSTIKPELPIYYQSCEL